MTVSRDNEMRLEVSDSGGVQAVEVGAQVLRVLVSAGRPVPLKMVSTATGMPRAKVHRYLVSLVRCGLASQEESTGYYGLGSFAVQAGLSALGTLDRDAFGAQFGNDGLDALLFDGAQAVGRHAQADEAALALDPETLHVQVGEEAATTLVVGV